MRVQTEARFFFSVRFRDRLLPDREGVQLGAGTDLDVCARYLADRLAGDPGLAGVRLDGCAVEVSDARGDVLIIAFLPSGA